MVELAAQDSVAARAFEFLVLTASRKTEVLGARWDEINLAERVWIVPAERMKAGREHRVPLSAPAIAIVERMAAIKCDSTLFPGVSANRGLGGMAFWRLLSRMGRGDLTTHGFRSSFRDWCAEKTHFPAEVAEMALAHTVSDRVEAAYRRGDLFEKRRQLADAWANRSASARRPRRPCCRCARRGKAISVAPAKSACQAFRHRCYLAVRCWWRLPLGLRKRNGPFSLSPKTVLGMIPGHKPLWIESRGEK